MRTTAGIGTSSLLHGAWGPRGAHAVVDTLRRRTVSATMIAFPPQMYIQSSISDTQEFPDGPMLLDFANYAFRVQKKSPEVRAAVWGLLRGGWVSPTLGAPGTDRATITICSPK